MQFTIILIFVYYSGIGSDHAKFQPGIAWYRMLPQITLLKQIEGDNARRLQKFFSEGVIELETNNEGNYMLLLVYATFLFCINI